MAFAVSFPGSKSAHADDTASYVWTGSGNLWGNNKNWIPSYDRLTYPNGAGETAYFEGGINQTSLLVDGGYTVGTISFGNDLGNDLYTISSQTGSDGGELHFLTLDGDGSEASITNGTSAVQTINIGLLLHSNATFSATKAGGTLSFTKPENGSTIGIDIGSYSLDLTGPGTILVNRSLFGSGTITNDGSDTTFLAGNGFSGNLVNNGVLIVGNSSYYSSLGTGNITNYGTLSLANISAVLNRVVANTTNATMNFNDSSNAGGATYNNSGTLNFNDSSSGTDATFNNNGTLNFNDHSTAGINTITNNGSLVFSGNSSAYSSTIYNNSYVSFTGDSSTGSATVNNNGYMFFSGTATSGGQLINAGQLIFSDTSVESSILNNYDVVTFTGNAKSFGSQIYNFATAEFIYNSVADSTLIGNSISGNLQFRQNSYIIGGQVINSGNMAFNDATEVDLATIDNGESTSQFDGTDAYLNFNNTSLIAFDTITNEGNLHFNDNAKLFEGIVTNTNFLSFTGNSNASTISDSRLPDASSNDYSQITNEAQLNFYDSSTAGTAHIYNYVQAYFNNSSNAGTSTIVNENDGIVSFLNSSSAMNAVIDNEGGSVEFKDGSSANNVVIVNSAHTPDQYDNSFSEVLAPSGVDISLYTGNGGVSIGELSGNGPIRLGSNTLTLGGLGTNDTISGVIGLDNDYFKNPTNGSLVKIGSGTLTLTGANVYTGTTTVSGGILAAGNASALGTSAVVMNGGTLDLSGVTGGFTIGEIGGYGTVAMGSNVLIVGAAAAATTSDTLDATLTDGGINGGTGASLIKVGPGTLILTAINTFTGATYLDAGTLLVGSDASLGAQGKPGLIYNGGTFGYVSDPNSASGVHNALTGKIVLGGVGSGFYAQNPLDTLDVYADVSGNSLTAAGNGMVSLLSTNNTYSGETDISGNLSVGDGATGVSSSLGSGNGSVNVTGTLNLNAGSSLGGAPIINNGAITFNDTSTAGNASITNNGSVNLHDMSSLGSATYSGFGTLSLYENASLGSANIVSSDAIYLNGNSTSANATITNNYGAVFFDGNSTGWNGSLAAHDGQTGGIGSITNLGTLGFTANSSAESEVIGSQGHYASLFFSDNASAGNATITNEGNFNFFNNATAESATITNEAYYGGDPNNGKTSANLSFLDNASAGNATIVSNGANSRISFQNDSSAGTATITNNGGSLQFAGESTADNATVVNNAASGGGGGGIGGGGIGGGAGAGALNLAGLGNGGGGSTLSIGSLSGSGDVDLAGNTLMLGNRNGNDTISGTIRDQDAYNDNYGPGSLVKIGAGTLTLTGANTYSGGTTINSGTVVASGTALGTGLVTVNAGGTLGVGSAANTTNASQPVGGLTIGSLSLATTASGVPALTFNLAPGSASDMLTIIGTGADVFSSSGAFEVGFASASGSDLAADAFTLITFTGQTTTDNLPSLGDYLAAPTGNLQSVSTGPSAFQYVTNGNGQETLVFLENGGSVIHSSDAMPEPSSLGLLALVLLPVGCSGAATYRRVRRVTCS